MKNLDLNTTDLESIAQYLSDNGKGLLAADESVKTISKRFEPYGISSTQESRNEYRKVLFSSKSLGNYVSGAILYEEQLFGEVDGVKLTDMLIKQDIYPGIKVDLGALPMPESKEETLTIGLDDLDQRLANYYQHKARFAKWRAVIKIDTKNNYPSDRAIYANAYALARYAYITQLNDMVPIVEPEVLMDGDHSIEDCYEVTDYTLKTVVQALQDADVFLEGMILKPNMVIKAKQNKNTSNTQDVAEETLKCLYRTVPAAIPGIMFLSGGQKEIEATQNLNTMNNLGQHPWKLSFSYGRALQESALKAWQGKDQNIEIAQKCLIHRSKMNQLAALGQWSEKLENEFKG